MTPSEMCSGWLLKAVSLLFFFLHSAASQFVVTGDLETTPELEETTGTHPPSSTTPKSTPGPDDLNSTDWIIIGCTIAMACGVMIGGSIYCWKASRANKAEKEDIYSRYLDRDELAGIKDGVENEAYSAGY